MVSTKKNYYGTHFVKQPNTSDTPSFLFFPTVYYFFFLTNAFLIWICAPDNEMKIVLSNIGGYIYAYTFTNYDLMVGIVLKALILSLCKSFFFFQNHIWKDQTLE